MDNDLIKEALARAIENATNISAEGAEHVGDDAAMADNSESMFPRPFPRSTW